MDGVELLLDQYGIGIIYLLVLLYIAQMLRSQAKNIPKLVEGWNTSQTQYATLDTTVTTQASESRQRDTALLDYLRANDTMVSQLFERVLTGQGVILGTVESMSKTVLQTNQLISETVKTMDTADINEKLDRALAILERLETTFNDLKPEVATLKTNITGIDSRLTCAEDGLLTVRDDVMAIKKAQTQETDPPAPIASVSKTNARRKTDEQETPVVKPEPTKTDTPPTDAIPKGN